VEAVEADAITVGYRGCLTRQFLVAHRTRALRRRVWFGALDHIERGLVDLTIRYVDQVKSKRLRQVLVEILEKLAQAMERGMGRILGRGRMRAARASELAVGWGNRSAFYWRFEQAFCNALGHGITG
jgi:hypothetical protein